MYYAIIKGQEYSGAVEFSTLDELRAFHPGDEYELRMYDVEDLVQSDADGIVRPLVNEERFTELSYKTYFIKHRQSLLDRIRCGISSDYLEVVKNSKLIFPLEIPLIIRCYGSLKEYDDIQSRLEAGYLNADYDRQFPSEHYIGHFKTPELVEVISTYTSKGTAFGYIGHKNRMLEMDDWFESFVTDHPDRLEDVAEWISSSRGRHAMDQFETLESFLSGISHCFQI